jgi:serine/threonine protein kinase
MATSGQRLGPYEILAAIGAGGMGEVYRARDTRLDRVVAIKILPDHNASKPELRERFEREARAVAALNHAHICVLHDIGHQNGTDYLVMEYLEGETLAQRLTKGALPLDQVLRYAIEIADALDKAHCKGITHRDLKPGNIMLTKAGAKLLDFGLAKLTQQDTAANMPLSQASTKGSITGQGVILGRVQYMAPEQVEGKDVDARTDIFAFGVVVYEMATGKKAFEGKTQASLIAKILEIDPPPISSLQPMTPPALDRVVRKCLAKEPEKRWQDASDLCDELRWISESSAQPLGPRAISTKGIPALGPRPLVLGLGALIIALITALMVWNLKPSPASPSKAVSRFTIPLPPGQSVSTPDIAGTALALSPDGTKLAYVASEKGTQRIYLRAMDGFEARPLSGTEGGDNPFFSPDSQWLGFSSGGKLRKVSVNGGAVVTLSEAAGLNLGASWSSQGTIVLGGVGGLQQIPDGGGTLEQLTHLERGDAAHGWPELLPNGESMLFTVATNGPPRLAVQALRSGKRQNLIAGGTPHFVDSGQLVYAQAGTLMAAPFDLRKLTITSAAIPVVEGILQSPITGAAQYSISSTGTLAYVPGSATVQSRLVWVSRTGVEQLLLAPTHAYLDPRLSPDGRTIAVGTSEDGLQIALFDVGRETLSRFTFEGNNRVPIWTPDGKHIVFWSDAMGEPANLFWQRADGSGGREQLRKSNYLDAPFSFSADGELLSFVELKATGDEIWVLRMSDRKAQPFLSASGPDAPEFSPDGRWLAYVSEESGRREVYVQPYPGPGGKYQISPEGGTEPVWNRNGRELFYRNGDKMMAVDIYTEPSFAAGKPRQLFEGDYILNYFAGPYYDVSSDGQRFLMLKPVEHAQVAPSEINVVLNFFEQLKQKVPTGKK